LGAPTLGSVGRLSALRRLWVAASIARAWSALTTRLLALPGRSSVVIEALVQRPCRSGSPKEVRGAWYFAHAGAAARPAATRLGQTLRGLILGAACAVGRRSILPRIRRI